MAPHHHPPDVSKRPSSFINGSKDSLSLISTALSDFLLLPTLVGVGAFLGRVYNGASPDKCAKTLKHRSGRSPVYPHPFFSAFFFFIAS
jgi:hypothetical protein